MGPVFYLVQCEEARCLISAVILGNWPHEFALAPSPGKKGGRRRPRVAGGVCGRLRLCVCAAKTKARFLDPVQPLSAGNNDGQWQALRRGAAVRSVLSPTGLNGQRVSVSHPGSHFGRFRRPAGYGVMGGRPRRSPHPQEVPQAGSAAQRRPAGARGAGRWPRVVAGGGGVWVQGRLAGRTRYVLSRAHPNRTATGPLFTTRNGPFLPKRGLLLYTDNARKRQA